MAQGPGMSLSTQVFVAEAACSRRYSAFSPSLEVNTDYAERRSTRETWLCYHQAEIYEDVPGFSAVGLMAPEFKVA